MDPRRGRGMSRHVAGRRRPAVPGAPAVRFRHGDRAPRRALAHRAIADGPGRRRRLVAGGGGAEPGLAAAPWSGWTPPDGGRRRAGDRRVRRAHYRSTRVDQLAVVTVVNLESADAEAAAARPRPAARTATAPAAASRSPSSPSPTSSAVSLLGGSTIAYNLCGIGGKNCAIGVGTPSTARLLLLRREALELALYTLQVPRAACKTSWPSCRPATPRPTSTLTHKLPTTPPRSSRWTSPCSSCARSSRRCSPSRSPDLPEPVPPTVAEMPGAPRRAGLAGHRPRAVLRAAPAGPGRLSLIVLDPLPPQ